MKTSAVKNILDYILAGFIFITFLLVLGFAGSAIEQDFDLVKFFKLLPWAIPSTAIAWVSYKIKNYF